MNRHDHETVSMTEPARQPWEARIVADALPSGAVPTAALWMPVAGRALRNSPDDVVALTEQQVRSRLPQGEQLVMSIREDDLIYQDDDELARLVDSTDGGAIVIGLTYDRQNVVRVYDQTCPECGSADAQRLGPADEHVAPGLRDQASLYQCADCGTAWDA
jgi:predicted RNA-binding Zn-ribbon protein involved in translation (DUF1610 family)